MVDKAAVTGAEEDVFAVLEENVGVVPSNAPAMLELHSSRLEARIPVAVTQALPGGGNRLVTTIQPTADAPFPPAGDARPVNDGVYDPVLAASLAADGRICLAAVRAADKGVDLIVQHAGESAAGPGPDAAIVGNWDPPIDLGRPDEAGFKVLQLGLDAQGRIAIFGVSQAGEVWWRDKNPPDVVNFHNAAGHDRAHHHYSAGTPPRRVAFQRVAEAWRRGRI